MILDYAKDARETVITLVQGNEFSEARRIVREGIILSISNRLLSLNAFLDDAAPKA